MTSRLTETSRPSTIRTFLIADIRGWTRFTRELGDEAASRLAAKFAQIVGEGVEAWGGRLLELRGDEAMCTFESARRALRCAVELQEAFSDESVLAPELPLNVGIGLDAGEAVPVGDGYRGSALNVAARLCSTAAAGEVIATASLVHLGGRVDGLAFAALEAKPMKGFDEPVAAVLVDSAAPHEHDHAPEAASPVSPPPLPAELDAVVPLVGREADLRWLSWHWRRARHGHSGVVAISGVAGMGRTRLAAELASAAHRDGAAVAYGPAGDGHLVVIDDVDELSDQHAVKLAGALERNAAYRLVLMTTRDPSAESVARRFPIIRLEEHHRRLGPIDLAAVTEIGRLYLDDPDVDVPAHLLHEESRGIPAAIHRVASQWAGATARRRLGESARRTSRERRDLRTAEAEMIGDVERLEHTRERARLYVPDHESQGAEDAALARTVCPYKGLAAFEVGDVEYYFGRERLVAELIARMVGSAFIGLIGASGSGKSSALQAGLLPALAGGVIPGSDEWIQVYVRPGDHPMRELRRALHRTLPHQPGDDASPGESLETALADLAPAQRLLLVVDQFEELFTSATDEGERAEFIDLLTAQRPRTKVVAAVRADHYERCAAYPRLARLIGADQVLVGPVTAEEIAAIIRHPAERVGLRVERELVDALVADIGTEPGGLPLLSTALLELWEARAGDRLTLSAYRTTGGVRGAVARMAESVYSRLEPDEQAATRSTFLRLAGETDDGAIIRRRVSLDELDLDGGPGSHAVVGALTQGRLLTASEGYVEVSHEALLREWPRLRSWIEEDSSGRQLRLHLMSAARAWDEGGREDGDLYRGARLAATLDWTEEHGGELNAVERTFVDESRAAAERAADEQSRRNRRLRSLLVGTASFLVLAVAAGALAMFQSVTADRQRALAEENAALAATEARRADDEADYARGRELWASAIAVLERDPELTLLLSLEAAEHGVDPPPEAVTALHAAVQKSRSILSTEVPAGEIRPVRPGVAVSHDGEHAYATSGDGQLYEFEVASGVTLREFDVGSGATIPTYPTIALSRDGRRLAHVDPEGVLHLIDLRDGTSMRHQVPGRHGDEVVWSPDGRLVATITYEGQTYQEGSTFLSVIEAHSGVVKQQWTFEFLWSMSFHPDSRRLLATACPCNDEPPVMVLDVESGDLTVQVESHQALVETGPTAARFNHAGTMLATVGRDKRVNVWDTESGALVSTLFGHTLPATDIVFSPDDQLIATTGRDGAVKVWDVARNEVIIDLVGQGGFPGLPAFSSDGSRLVTGSTDMSVRVWDLSAMRGSEGPGIFLGDEFLQIRDLDARGGMVAALGRGCRVRVCVGSVGVIALDTRDVLTIPGQLASAVALSPDGSLVVSQAEDPTAELFGGPMHLYSTESGDVAVTLESPCSKASKPECVELPAQLQGATFHPSGNQLALAGFSFHGEAETFGWSGVWDMSGRLLHLETELMLLEFHPRAEAIAMAGSSGVVIRDTDEMADLATLAVPAALGISFSPDGKWLAVSSSDNVLRLYETGAWSVLHEIAVVADHLTFSDDGLYVMASDAAGIIRVWDLETGDLVHTIPVLKAGPGSTVNHAFFVNGGLLTIDSRSILTMALDVDDLLRIGSTRVSRPLTNDECRTYLHVAECPSDD